jgi:hypothetical protein
MKTINTDEGSPNFCGGGGEINFLSLKITKISFSNNMKTISTEEVLIVFKKFSKKVSFL